MRDPKSRAEKNMNRDEISESCFMATDLNGVIEDMNMKWICSKELD